MRTHRYRPTHSWGTARRHLRLLAGDAADAFYLLAAGAVRVTETFRNARRATIRYVRPGETFGESVLFNDTYPSCTETMEASRLYRFDTGEFRRLMLAEPELALLIIVALAHLLVMLNQRIEELLLPVPARLAAHRREVRLAQGPQVLSVCQRWMWQAIACGLANQVPMIRLTTHDVEPPKRLGLVQRRLTVEPAAMLCSA